MRRVQREMIMGAASLVLAISAAAQDSGADALPAGVRRIPPERLGNYWLLIPETAEAHVPNSGYGLDAPTCVAVSYVVEKNGTTSHVKLEKVVPPGPLGKVAFNVVAGMRFATAPQNAGKDPVATWVVMPFNVPDAASTKPADKATRERVLAPCQLDAPSPPK